MPTYTLIDAAYTVHTVEADAKIANAICECCDILPLYAHRWISLTTCSMSRTPKGSFSAEWKRCTAAYDAQFSTLLNKEN